MRTHYGTDPRPGYLKFQSTKISGWGAITCDLRPTRASAHGLTCFLTRLPGASHLPHSYRLRPAYVV